MNWKDKINKKYTQISIYVIITAVIIYFLILVLGNAPVLTRVVWDKLRWIIGVIQPLIIGFAFAYIMDPMVDFFEIKYRKLKNVKILNKIVAPRTWAAFTSVFCLVIAVAGLISLLVFTVTNQLRLANLNDIVILANAYINNLKGFLNSITEKLNQLNIQSKEFEQYIQNATTFLVNSLINLVEATFSSARNLSNYMTTFIFSFIIGFYFMIDGKLFINYVKKVFKALFNEKANKRIGGIMRDLDQVFSGYIRGQLTDAIFMMILISTILSITGVKFAIVIGIFAGVGNLIPYFGPIVAYVSTSAVCLINGDFRTWIISMIALFLVQAIDGNLIGPKLLSQSIKIHPLIIIISIIFGSALGGFLGMLLAVPVGAYIKLVFVRFINRRLDRMEEANKTGSN